MNNKVAKFRIIHEIISAPDNLLALDDLCRTAGVSKSGYYYWLNTSDFQIEKKRKTEKTLN